MGRRNLLVRDDYPKPWIPDSAQFSLVGGTEVLVLTSKHWGNQEC